jgi:hypothetical protein
LAAVHLGFGRAIWRGHLFDSPWLECD